MTHPELTLSCGYEIIQHQAIFPVYEVSLKEIRARKIAVYDLPLADKNTAWVTLPAIQG